MSSNFDAAAKGLLVPLAVTMVLLAADRGLPENKEVLAVSLLIGCLVGLIAFLERSRRLAFIKELFEHHTGLEESFRGQLLKMVDRQSIKLAGLNELLRRSLDAMAPLRQMAGLFETIAGTSATSLSALESSLERIAGLGEQIRSQIDHISRGQERLQSNVNNRFENVREAIGEQRQATQALSENLSSNLDKAINVYSQVQSGVVEAQQRQMTELIQAAADQNCRTISAFGDAVQHNLRFIVESVFRSAKHEFDEEMAQYRAVLEEQKALIHTATIEQEALWKKLLDRL
jgi:hypothetical protein